MGRARATCPLDHGARSWPREVLRALAAPTGCVAGVGFRPTVAECARFAHGGNSCATQWRC
eukprot:2618859-Alexandrium_andersonii.AAC.1